MRERFLNVVREVQPANGWKVVVVDAASVKLISSAVRTLDILEEGVSLVENLEIRRQPMPTMEAIYFIEPSDSSVNKIKHDFSDPENSRLQSILSQRILSGSGLTLFCSSGDIFFVHSL